MNAQAQYGPRIRAAAVYLNTQQLIPEDRVCELLGDLFATLSLCPASVTNWVEKMERRLERVVAHIAALIVQAPVRHLDET